MNHIRLFESYTKSYKENDLWDKLISKGGNGINKTHEEDLNDLMIFGDFYDVRNVDDFNSRLRYEIIPMRQSSCHRNSANFYENFINDSDNSEDEISIVTGWALSDNDIWYQHSWIFLHYDDIIIETTEERKIYYGFILRGNKLTEFLDNN